VGIARRGGYVLRVASVQVNANALLAGTVLVHTPAAGFAGTALDAVVQHHPITGLQRCLGIGTDGGDFTGHVASQNPRQRAPVGAALPHTQVQVVQGAAPDAKHDLARSHFGLGSVSVDQLVQSTVLADEYGFHCKKFSSRNMGLRRASTRVP